MRQPPSRRTILKAGAAAGAVATLPFGFAGPASAEGDRLTVRIARDIQNLDPANRPSFIEGNVILAVCQRLIAFKPGTFEWEPDAAASIAQTSPTLIDFALKPGLAWHDGSGTMTAEDVKFSFERFRTPGPDGKLPQYAKDWEALDHVEVTGPLTGRIHLKSPAPALWLVTLPDSSGAIVSRSAFKADGGPKAGLVGTGPMTFAGWEPNQRVTLRANPAWTGPRPGFPEIVLRPVADPKTAELALRAGELDFTGIDPASTRDMERVPATRVISQDSINFVWIGINVEKPPFDNPKVREAMRMAIDIDQVILAAYDGAVERAKSLIAPPLLGHWPDAPVHKRDAAAAKRLLTEAGHRDGFPARITVLNTPAYRTAAVVVQAMLSEIGIAVEIEALDGGSFWSMGEGEQGRNLELSIQRFGGKADPAFQTQWFVSEQVGQWNWQRWKNADYDRLYAEAAATLDPAERARLYVAMQQLMDQSAAFIWLTHEVNVFAARDWLEPAILPNGDDLLYHRFHPA